MNDGSTITVGVIIGILGLLAVVYGYVQKGRDKRENERIATVKELATINGKLDALLQLSTIQFKDLERRVERLENK